VQLTRLVRFAVNPVSDLDSKRNGYGGAPPIEGFAAFYQLRITARGTPDPATGYFLDIKTIDRAARIHVIPQLCEAFLSTLRNPSVISNPLLAPARVLADRFEPLSQSLGGGLTTLRLDLSPFTSQEITMSDPARAVIRHRFEIAAAHRLHAPTLSDEANRAYFGKCNNPSSHGHNYIIEPAIAVPLTLPASSPPVTMAAIEEAVKLAILDPFDHTNLNIDTAEFDQARGGLNPSVENISAVFYRKLQSQLARSIPHVTLMSMTVFETEKTSSTYPA
jgi:6-pyruvoyltetrahydropterin/6-carboxytetrahydropterin synthase